MRFTAAHVVETCKILALDEIMREVPALIEKKRKKETHMESTIHLLSIASNTLRTSMHNLRCLQYTLCQSLQGQLPQVLTLTLDRQSARSTERGVEGGTRSGSNSAECMLRCQVALMKRRFGSPRNSRRVEMLGTSGVLGSNKIHHVGSQSVVRGTSQSTPLRTISIGCWEDEKSDPGTMHDKSGAGSTTQYDSSVPSLRSIEAGRSPEFSSGCFALLFRVMFK